MRDEFAYLPPPALDLLDRMLDLDPSKRVVAEEALKCAWLVNIRPSQVAAPKFPLDQDCHEMWSKELKKRKRTVSSSGGNEPVNGQTSQNVNTSNLLNLNSHNSNNNNNDKNSFMSGK